MDATEVPEGASQLVKFLMIVSGIEEDNEMPAAVNMVGEDTPTAMDVVDEEMKIGGFEWAAVPQYGETTARQPMVEEEEKELLMTAGCDPHGDEPTGVDKEWRKNKSEAGETSATEPETSKIVVESSPMPHSSQVITTRRMASLSPTSPGVTTRKMAAISPGGINRRLIIE
ncbi:hypothetical protein C2845_PM10G10280 [Panicum miliaceum]|uniref:Uncharacterized protein n=1 Tax=Panicum miliaceum TaxID=4540 RepID=A0A3L6PEJ7_PANMI|nr:hypothetical protein C2845_PM10G10280 [Panicum miliaceum]